MLFNKQNYVALIKICQLLSKISNSLLTCGQVFIITPLVLPMKTSCMLVQKKNCSKSGIFVLICRFSLQYSTDSDYQSIKFVNK